MVPCSRAAAVSKVHHLLAGQRVERAGRLVGEQHLGPGDQAAGQRDPLGLAAGQLTGPAPLQAVQVEPAEPGRRLRQRLGPARRRPAAAAGPRSPRRSAPGRAGRTGTRSRTGPGAARCARPRRACRLRCPSKQISPESGRRMPARQCSSVDFPDPLGPMTARISPRRRSTGWRRAARGSAEGQHDVACLDQASRRARPRQGACGLLVIVTSSGRSAVIELMASASASSRRRGQSIQRRSASRWNRPWSASSASTRLAGALELGQLPHPPQVRGALGVEVVLGRPAQHQRQHDLGEQHRLQVRLGFHRLGEPGLDLGHARLGDRRNACGPGRRRARPRRPRPCRPGPAGRGSRRPGRTAAACPGRSTRRSHV